MSGKRIWRGRCCWGVTGKRWFKPLLMAFVGAFVLDWVPCWCTQVTALALIAGLAGIVRCRFTMIEKKATAEKKRAPGRRRRPLTEIRQGNIDHIVKAAEKQFANHGFSGTTVSAIAEAAGLPKPNLLYYFKSKEGLYRAVLKRILRLWMEAMNDLRAEDHPREALRGYIVRKLRQSRDFPDASRIFAAEILHGAPYVREELEGPLKAQFDDTVAVFRAWIAKGWMEPVNPEHLMFTLWASTQAYADYSLQMKVLLGRDELTDDDFDNAIELLTRLILKGCGINIV